MPRTTRLPRRLWWRAFLRQTPSRLGPDGHGPGPTLAAVEATYHDLMADPPAAAAAHPVLGWHLRQSIGPILALYLVALRQTGDRPYARAEAERAMIGQMKPMLLLYAAADRVGLPFRLLRVLTRQLLTRMFPAPGFAVSWRADSPEQLAFDIHGCFYLRVLSHYRAPELTGVFCLGDEILFHKLPRSVQFSRSGTLALGASHCDFTFHPVVNDMQGKHSSMRR